MRRDQNNKGSQIVRNLAYNPSFEVANISSVLRTNNVINPSLETAGATTAVRTNILTNPSAETATGLVNTRTNLAINPSFEATSGVTNVRQNLLVNPSMENGTGTTTIRTNLAPNPNATVSAGYFAVNGVTATLTTNQAGGPVNGNTFARTTATGTATGMNYFGIAYGQPGGVNGAQVVAGTTYTLSAYVRATMTNFTAQPTVRLRFKDAAGATLTDYTVAATGATSGQWKRISSTATAPVSASYVEALGGYVSLDQSTITVGDTVDVSAILVEATNTMWPYFDGTNPAAENLVRGVAATAQSGVTITTGVAYAGATWSRATTVVGSGTGIARQFVNLSDLLNGETYTASVTVANDQAFSQTISLDWCDQMYLNITLAPGEQRRIYTTATLAAYTSVYHFSDLQLNQSTTEARSLLYKDFLIERGTTTGEYYTGTGDFTYAWNGTINASPSTLKAPQIGYWALSSGATVAQSSIQKNSLGKSLAVYTKGQNGDGTYSSDVSGIIAGASYTFSAWVKTTSSVQISLDYRWKDAGNATLSDTIFTPATTVGSWTRISATAVAPTGVSVSLLQPMIRIYATHTATIFYVDDAMVERASGLDTYFDGTTAASGDFTFVWSGTAHASISNQQAPMISTWMNRWFGNAGGNGALYQAKGGLSGTFARKVWTSANNSATMDAGINLPPVGISASTPYTLSAWVRSSVAQYMNFYIDWRDSGNGVLGATQQGVGTAIAANTWTRLSVTATSPSAATAAYFVIGPYGQALTMPYNSTLDFDNVLIEAAPVAQDYFDGANPIQNLIANPSFDTDTSTWTLMNVQGGSGRNTIRSYVGNSSLYMVANDNQGDDMAVLTATIPVNPFTTYTVSAYAYVPAGVVASDFRTSSRNLWAVSMDGATATITQGNLDFAKTNQWQRVSTTITIPSATSGLSVRLYAPANALGIYWDAVMVEKTSALNPYYAGTGDYTYAWAGAANTTVSYQQAPTVTGTGYASNLAMSYQSKTSGITSGTKSIRITPVHATNGDSFVDVTGMLGGYTFKANTTYTISGNRTILAPQTNINGTTHFRVSIGTETGVAVLASVVNVAGTQRVVGRFTTGASTTPNFIRLYNGSFFGGGDVWWDDMMLEEGMTDGTYFDGANPLQNLITNSSFETDTSLWTADTGAPTLTVDSSVAWIGTKSMKAATTVSSTDVAVRMSNNLLPNMTYTFSWYVYSPDARTASFDLAGSPSFSISALGSKAIPANTWTRVSGTFTTPSVLYPGLAFYLHHKGGPSTIGAAVYIDAVLLEASGYLHTYYAGLGDFTYAWTGTANASSTEQRAPSVSDRQTVATVAASYQSTVRSNIGSKSGSVRARADIFADNTIMYPVNEYFVGAGITASVSNTWSMWVWVPSGSGTVRLQDTTTGVIGSPNTTFDAWERISVTFTGNTTGAHVLRMRAATTITAGTVIWWDNEMLEATYVALPYFDGATAAAGDYTYAWSGTANASTSYQRGLPISTTALYYATAIQSSDWASSVGKSMRITPNASSSESFAGFLGNFGSLGPLEAGKNYTALATLRLTAPLTGGLYSRALQMVWRQNGTRVASVQGLNVVGVQKLRLNFTVSPGTTNGFIELFNGASAGGGDVWWDDFMVVEGDYQGDYIDGTKPFSKWDGAVNASVSAGYPPQFFDIAGPPALDNIGTTLSVSPTVDGFVARTLYVVYETTNDNSTSWQVPFMYGSQAPNQGFTVQTASSGNYTMSPRIDFATGGGDINKGFNFPNGRTLARRHVLAVSFNQGLTSVSAYGDGSFLTTMAINPGTVGWTNGQLRNFNASTVKAIHTMVFYTEHDGPTKLALSRYLGNRYGAAVA